MEAYQGHRSWNAWNVALWIGNDEGLYRFAMECIKQAKQNAGKAARRFMNYHNGERTPDGAKYNHLSVKLCLQAFINNA